MNYDKLVNQHLALSDSQLLEMKFILVDGTLQIVLKFNLVYLPKAKMVSVTFRKIKEYSFSHSREYPFSDMSFCKFLYVGDMYFISLDPYDQEDVPHDNDNNYIYAEEAFTEYEVSD